MYCVQSDTQPASSFAALNSQQSPQDVCFVFPGMTAKLWASSEVLVDRSAYYESLLCSDFSESTMHTDSETAAATSNRAPVSDLFDDSDDETDEHFEAINMQPARLTRPDPLPRKEVVINDTAFTTYQATLVWMSSCYIRFAPLRSSCEGLTSGIHDSRMHIISEIIEASPRTSLPASPKSVYRLAHLLELKDLQEIALHNLHAQLTVRNAATELFSDVASAYPAVRDAILPYAVRNWAAVCTSSAYEKVKERADAGDLPIGAAHTALLLSERINERIKAP